MGVLRQSRNGRIHKDLQRQPYVLGVQFLTVGREFFVATLFLRRDRSHFLRQLVVVHKTIGLVLSYPPLVVVDLDVVPSTPEARGTQNNGRLSKGRDVVVVKLHINVLQELNRPDHIKSLSGPPGPAREIVLGKNRFIGNHRLLDGVVASLDALGAQPVRDEPRGGDPPSATDVQNRLDGPLVDGVFPDGGRYTVHIDFGKATQVLLVSFSTVDVTGVIDRFLLHDANRWEVGSLSLWDGEGRIGKVVGGAACGLVVDRCIHSRGNGTIFRYHPRLL
mmetsp:Transcript_21628/g.48630  ORF Transcript_21628/g.48630 Transcript_21628/m.48630 type:complete len:277 (-) Transcript_21628:221-1051(-)